MNEVVEQGSGGSQMPQVELPCPRPEAGPTGEVLTAGRQPQRRWRRWLLGAGLLIAALIGMAYLNNNVAWQFTSRAAFAAQLDRADQYGTVWLILSGQDVTQNPALLYMVDDVARLSGDLSLRILVESGRRSYGSNPWRRMLERDAEVHALTCEEWAGLQNYVRWFLYAVAPSVASLTEQDRADMFDPAKHRTGSLTHQLFALLLYRERVGRSGDLDALIDRLCERIAAEAAWDVRVTDLYLQRVALLMAAGRPDLVRRRWVERVLGNQQADGGWISSWFGLGPGLRRLEFSLEPQHSNSHTSAQGLWICAMLRDRYPHWIDENYP
jgi:hypothetical protein